MRNRLIALVAVAAALVLCQTTTAHASLRNMLHRGGCCGAEASCCGAEQSCCEAAPACDAQPACDAAPSCCGAENSCCEEDSCCGHRHHLRGLLHKLFHHHGGCCEAESSCCEAAAPTCCGN